MTKMEAVLYNYSSYSSNQLILQNNSFPYINGSIC